MPKQTRRFETVMSPICGNRGDGNDGNDGKDDGKVGGKQQYKNQTKK